MRVYTIHEPPDRMADRIERAERLRFVADGFDWTAALFAPFALLAAGLYAWFAVYAVALGAVVAVFFALGVPPATMALAIAAVHVLVGYEYGEWQRAHLDGAGWTDAGIVTGARLADCERRFFGTWLPRQPMLHSGDFPGDTASTVVGRKPVQQALTARLTAWRPWAG